MVIRHEFGKLYYMQINGHWYINIVWVDPNHRNEGVGTWLMKVALRRCGRPVFLFATNELGGDLRRLKKFYKGFGFMPIRQTKCDTFPYKYNMILEKGGQIND